MSETIRSLSEKLMVANERCDEKDKQITALSLSVKSLGEQLAEAKDLLTCWTNGVTWDEKDVHIAVRTNKFLAAK